MRRTSNTPDVPLGFQLPAQLVGGRIHNDSYDRVN